MHMGPHREDIADPEMKDRPKYGRHGCALATTQCEVLLDTHCEVLLDHHIEELLAAFDELSRGFCD